jgi:DNA-binding MltR family transcriptional regulator
VARRPPKPPDRPANPRHKKDRQSRNSEKPSLHDFSRREPNVGEWEETINDILNAHDRAAAIILASQAELWLQQLLISYMPNGNEDILFSANGPLSGFYAKNQLAFAMGIIPLVLLQDLEVIRRVRNAFAHAPATIRFSDTPVMEECRKLSTNPIHRKRLRATKKGGLIGKLMFDVSMVDVTTERGNFLLAANDVCMDLLNLLRLRGS